MVSSKSKTGVLVALCVGVMLTTPALAKDNSPLLTRPAKPVGASSPAEVTPADAPPTNTAAKPEEGQGGAGDLLVAPTRVVLDEQKRAAEVTLNNRGTKEATFRVSLVRMRMKDNGTYEDVDAKHPAQPGEAFADEVVRYSPHQVTLKPGESQAVKFAVRNLGTLASGEYRSHILFRGNPDMAKGVDLEQTTPDNKQISVRLIPVYGITIPLIVRHGDLAATASLHNAGVKGKKLTVTIERQGTKSLFGDVIVTAGSKTVGEVHGIAVYVPNDKRILEMDLTPPEGIGIGGAELSVTYREREEEGGKVLAETRVRG